MFSPLLRQLQELCLRPAGANTCRRRLRLAPASLIEALPALGSVLYMPLAACGPAMPEMPRGVLVEALQLAPLLQVRWLMASSVITVDGPREWIDGIDRTGCPCMRLHLLPDTDYLAWDSLLARGEPATAMPAPGTQRARAAAAYMLRFHRRRLAGLEVLGCEVASGLSPLSRQLAERIVQYM